MSVLSVRFSDEEYAALEKYAQINGVSMNAALKSTFFDMLENQFDMDAFDKAFEKFKTNPKTFSSEEIAKKLGL